MKVKLLFYGVSDLLTTEEIDLSYLPKRSEHMEFEFSNSASLGNGNWLVENVQHHFVGYSNMGGINFIKGEQSVTIKLRKI